VSEQTCAHDYSGGIWTVTLRNGDMIVGAHGCPDCLTRLEEDGSETPMVPAVTAEAVRGLATRVRRSCALIRGDSSVRALDVEPLLAALAEARTAVDMLAETKAVMLVDNCADDEDCENFNSDGMGGCEHAVQCASQQAPSFADSAYAQARAKLTEEAD